MFEITIQRAIPAKGLPSPTKLKQWALAALKNKTPSADITIRIINKIDMTSLNLQYRNKNHPTNVLSFPMDSPLELQGQTAILGDILICADIIQEEAIAQKKMETAHWAHMVVHGTLHLLGYDHEKKKDADIMEKEEVNILTSLGFHNPYLT